MSFSHDHIPSQTGRVAVITGANGGLGLATARVLAAKGAQVVMAVRDQAKAQAAHDTILAESPAAVLEIVPLDLSSQASVKQAAAEVLVRHQRIDLLINNAGVMATPEGRTVDGYETQLATNHLGHWTWTALLLSAVRASPAGRIVTVSSFAKHFGRNLDLTNPYLEGHYSAWRAYGNSKLANLHFAIGLNRRLQQAGASTVALSAYPGFTNSDLLSTTHAGGGGGIFGTLGAMTSGMLGMSVESGALNILRAATDPTAHGGQVFRPGADQLRATGSQAHFTARAGRRYPKALAFSEQITGVPLVVTR